MTCRIHSVPAGTITWYRAGTVLQNYSTEERGTRKLFVYQKTEGPEISSLLGKHKIT